MMKGHVFLRIYQASEYIQQILLAMIHYFVIERYKNRLGMYDPV